VLTELGTVQDVRLANTPEEEQSGAAKAKALVARARSSEIMGKITRANGVFRWSIVFGIVAVVGLVLVLSSPNDEGPNPQGGRPLIPLLDDFYYPPQPDLAYPACKLTKGFEVPGQGFSYMTDYILLAGLSYETANVTEYVLDKWFGSVGGVIDEVDFVDQWRRDNNLEAFGASFKLFSIPSMPGFGVVSVRGTQTATDNLLNAQLYMTSILMQFVRAALPLGWIFEDVYDDLITAVGWIGSEHLRKSAYYTVTTAFVNDLLQNNYTDRGKSFNTLRITGVSLGGGIAMITGAQTDANAVVFAGINPTLARQTFVPPLSLEAINTRLFNVHPEGDFKSLIGDLPRNFQKIGCIAPRSESSGCHSFWRGFCEFMVTCGSETRPVDCRCVQNYGYPKPIQNGTRSFEQACAEEEAIVKELG
jgi:lipase ATG15